MNGPRRIRSCASSRTSRSAGLWNEAKRAELEAECAEQITQAARTAEATPRPVLESVFSDVYAELPKHLRRQGKAAFDLASRKGDAAAGDGEFPL